VERKFLWIIYNREVIKLGGCVFRDEAAVTIRDTGVTDKDLLADAQGDVYLLFTKASIASIHTTALGLFLLFQAFVTLAICGAGILLSGQP
jgi:hypothetical protein